MPNFVSGLLLTYYDNMFYTPEEDDIGFPSKREIQQQMPRHIIELVTRMNGLIRFIMYSKIISLCTVKKHIYYIAKSDLMKRDYESFERPRNSLRPPPPDLFSWCRPRFNALLRWLFRNTKIQRIF